MASNLYSRYTGLLIKTLNTSGHNKIDGRLEHARICTLSALISTNGQKSLLLRFHGEKQTLPIPGSDQSEPSVFSVHLTWREECASECNIPTVVRSKCYAKGDNFGKGFWECMPCFYHGKEVGCFSNQTNKHLLRPCSVCKALWEIIKLSKTWYLTSRSLQPRRGNKTKTQF